MGISVTTISLLFVCAIFTAVMSTVTGIGGVLLFAVMASVLEYAVVVPMYGAVQTTSALCRVWLYRRDIIFSLFWPFLIAFLPAIALGIVVWLYLIEIKEAQPYIKMGIGIYLFVFISTVKFRVRIKNPKRLMIVTGVISGFLSAIVGVVGSLQAPFFAALDVTKEERVAIFSIASLLANGIKIPLLFVVMDRLSTGHGVIIGLIAISSVIGALAGRKIMGKISETAYRRVFHILLFLIACKLVFWDGIKVLWF